MFTEMSFAALVMNTNWDQARLVVYTDGDDFNPIGVFGQKFEAIPFVLSKAPHGGPVAIMNHFLSIRPGVPLCGGPPVSRIFAKIDNDTMVPPGWLDRCLSVMDANPQLDLLGIEPPSSTVGISLAGARNGYAPCDSIGGIGLMRRRTFEGRAPMVPRDTRGGFTDWQLSHPEVKKGWMAPSLPLFLLDRMYLEPWAGLSKGYIADGSQRTWRNYTSDDSHLWEWWAQGAMAAGSLLVA